MKKIYKNIVYLSFVAMLCTGCDDFLNVPVYDSIDEEGFWQTESQTRSYFYNFCNECFLGYTSYSTAASAPYYAGQFLKFPNSTPVYLAKYADDDFAYSTQNALSTSSTADVSNGYYWDFTSIRKANYAIESAEAGKWKLDPTTKAHWLGVAHYFRAHIYADMVFVFGDVPYYDKVIDASDTKELYKNRTSRVQVDDKIMEDLQFAMDNCRADDGYGQVNKYVAAAVASRFMLREGTFLKYHKDMGDGYEAESKKCLEFAKKASELVMNSGKYSLSADFNKLFTSEDLSTNNEVIMGRHYETGKWTHAMLSWCYTYGGEEGTGCSKSLAEAFLGDDGLPIATDPTDPNFRKTETAFFAHRDPRLALTIHPHYHLSPDTADDGKATPKYAPYKSTCSGYAYGKFMDFRLTEQFKDPTGKAIETGTLSDPKYGGNQNVTDAPCVRYGEVLINYAEIMYELGQLTQDVLDKTVNALRDRPGVDMPHLTMSGENAFCEGVQINDPKRLAIENKTNSGYVCSPILWEIRRERRVELTFEGTRMDDLKRWKKLDYLWPECNPDICYGPYIVDANYEGGFQKHFDDQGVEGYYSVNMTTNTRRPRPEKRDYIWSVPSQQVVNYAEKGYTLSQNTNWGWQ